MKPLRKWTKWTIARLAAFIILVVLMLSLFSGANANGQETCPDGGGWTKVDSGDLSAYPVDGATEYCFKAGSHDTVSEIPDGGFGQDGACKDGIQFCDLSHWSYFIGEPTATPVTPSATPTEPTETPTETPVTPTNTPDPSVTPDDTPTPSNTPEPTPTPTYDLPECEPIDPNGSCHGGMG